ncbi:MAG TPA: extracellular solute-binding protein [Chthoniobacterales bacterium]
MRERILNTIGIGLLAVCFLIAIARIVFIRFQSKSSVDGSKVVELRIAHWQLENGPRAAFEALANEYSRRHPNVRITQIPIPERIYGNWLVTQLVGGTPPDLIQLGIGMNDERLARFFTPLSELADRPNPYNDGTPFEGKPLRDTFADGMQGGYYPNLVEFYGVPISGKSFRMFYNLDLLREITGSERVPQTYDELIALCKRTQEYAAEKHVRMVPIAGSKYNGGILMQALFTSQTQKLRERLTPTGMLVTPASMLADRLLHKQWSLDTPDAKSGLTLMREVAQYMQPGFMQLLRDDAMLLFVQRGAVMITTGSWDATSIRQESPFRIGVGSIPYPAPDHPVYGRFTYGSIADAEGSNAGTVLGIPRDTKHPEETRDFLQFLGSVPGGQIWTDRSGWIPSVMGTKTSPDAAPFLPNPNGYVAGFSYLEGGADVGGIVDSNMHNLVSSYGSVDRFIAATSKSYERAWVSDLQRNRRAQADIVQRSDTQVASFLWLARKHPENAEAQHKADIALQGADASERTLIYTNMVLNSKANNTAP